MCQDILQTNEKSSPFIGLLLRGGSTKPRKNMAEYICSLSHILGIKKELPLTKYAIKVKSSGLAVLELFKNNICFMGPDHKERGKQYIHLTVIDTICNNEQSIQNGKIRKDESS